MQKRLEQVLPSKCLLSNTCGAALSMTSWRHTRQGKAPAAVQSSLLVTAAAAVAAALGCTAPRGSLAILGHQARVAGPRCAGAGVTGALQIPSLDASEAKRQLSIGDKVRLQQSGGPLRSCTMMVTIAVVKHSVSDRTLRLQPGVVAGGLLGCA